MSEGLFSDFDIKIEAGLSRENKKELFEGLRVEYMRKVQEARAKHESFLYLCGRCFKPIYKTESMSFDSHGGMPYGKGCWKLIQGRKTRLLLKYEEGRAILPQEEEVLKFSCCCCGREFHAYRENPKVCGVNVRCCFCCEHSTMRFRGQKCPVEVVATKL
jgi:hypothetical protein